MVKSEGPTEVDKILTEVKNVDSISAQLLLREAYEMTYGLIDEAEENPHPWELVSTTPKEEINKYGPLYRTLRAYRLNNVNDKFGYSFTEFLALPRNLVDEIFTICEEEAVVEAKAVASVSKDLSSSK